MNLKTKLKSLYLGTKFPDFVIIGAQKSGTTSLYHYLNSIQNLRGSLRKESQFLITNEPIVNYVNEFKFSFNREIKYFEASPEYLVNQNFPKRAFEVNEKMKLILLLRDPVDRAYSAWNMFKNIFDNNEQNLKFPFFYNRLTEEYKEKWLRFSSISDFHKTIEAEIQQLNSIDLENYIYDMPGVVYHGIYHIHLKRILNYFDLSQVHVINYSDFINNTKEEIEKLLDFIQIPFSQLDENVINNNYLKGNYTAEIDGKSKLLLEDYFENHNIKLNELLNKKVF
ncbi:sulfotransferase domain-containing protein [Flammeovirga sp. SubArs3]|uniref:sulfotransferase domain-containing protein n=1 Tax=Flammeovirga sp. SubArs3 TaxID=2995316 RepID=UPI00248AC4C4|nr:sulfotransferase domain-containing protein [Flammeovirga sp. SubArs3]